MNFIERCYLSCMSIICIFYLSFKSTFFSSNNRPSLVKINPKLKNINPYIFGNNFLCDVRNISLCPNPLEKNLCDISDYVPFNECKGNNMRKYKRSCWGNRWRKWRKSRSDEIERRNLARRLKKEKFRIKKWNIYSNRLLMFPIGILFKLITNLFWEGLTTS